MLRASIVTTALLASLFVANTASAAVYTFHADLVDHGAGYAGSTTATGSADFTYDDTTKELKGTITHDLADAYWYGVARANPTDPVIIDTIVTRPLTPLGRSPIAIDATLTQSYREQDLYDGKIMAFLPVQSGPRIDGALLPVGAVPEGGAPDAGDAGTSDAAVVVPKGNAPPPGVDPAGSSSVGRADDPDPVLAQPNASAHETASCAASPIESGGGIATAIGALLAALAIAKRRAR